MTERSIPQGATCLTATEARKKFAHGNTWLWDRVKNDPDFPQPIYLGTRPVFIEQELDAYLQRQRDRATEAEREAAARSARLLAAREAAALARREAAAERDRAKSTTAAA